MILDSDSGSKGVKRKVYWVPEGERVGLLGPRGSRDRTSGSQGKTEASLGSRGRLTRSKVVRK